ncbi:TRAP transporter small permease subunit [Algicella marina]|uniref:TRAP transporter small permease subunit n=1 Tax=Algicella marina TaxID=2683284 RepID=UPI0024DF6819|nr:TRAP transporter small permease [Algicella marina]
MTPRSDKDSVSSGGRLFRGWTFIVEGSAALGTMMIVGLMLIICADIVARNVFGASLPLVSELGGLLVVLIVALQLAATVRADRLAHTSVFIGPLSARRPRMAAALKTAFHLIGAAVTGGMAWASVRVLTKDIVSGEFIGTPGLGTLPTWPFRALILAGLTIAALEFLRRAGTQLASLRKPAP